MVDNPNPKSVIIKEMENADARTIYKPKSCIDRFLDKKGSKISGRAKSTNFIISNEKLFLNKDVLMAFFIQKCVFIIEPILR